MEPRQDLIEYLDILEQSFNPEDKLSLQALVFLFYCNYSIMNNEDAIFTEKLLALVEKCNLAMNDMQPQPIQECPTCLPCEFVPPLPGPQREGGPRLWAHDPYDMPRDLRTELVAAGARALFFQGAPAQRTRME